MPQKPRTRRSKNARTCECHLIGHLQSNKAARAAELFDGIDSLDSLRLAERLDEAAGRFGKKLPVLIEVKLSGEATKTGLDPESEEAAQLLERLPDFPSLEARGLMTIAPWGARGRRDTRLFPQLAYLARSLGRRASESETGCAFDGHERRFSAGHSSGRDAHPRRHGALWQAHAEILAIFGAELMLRATQAGVTLAVRAQPGAKRTAIGGIYGEGATAQLKIAVQAPPLEGRANDALIAFLAETFGLAQRRSQTGFRRACRAAKFFCWRESRWRRRRRCWRTR